MTNMIIQYVISAVVAYIIGNISPASIIAKKYKVNIREEGSGNPGTTNVIRVLGLKAGLITLLVDLLKGFIAVSIGFKLAGKWGGLIAFAMVVIGHCFPAFYKFKGGKGVATTFGAAIAMSWPSAVLAFIIAAVIFYKTGKMSMGSLSAAIIFPVLVLFYTPEYFLFSLFVTLFIVFTHRENIKRLKSGEEESINIKEKINEMKEKSNE